MAETLSYVINVRGGQRSRNEARKAASGMDDFTRSLSDADKEAGRFIDRQGKMREANGAFVTSTEGVTTAMRRGAGGITTFGGRLAFLSRIMSPLVGVLAVLSPSIIAVGASAAAAALGGGIVGGAGIAALATSLGGVGIIASGLIGQFGKVKDAQDALNLVTAQYGENSSEAVDAQIRFNAVLAENGGAPMLRMLERLNKLTERWTKLTAPAKEALFGIGDSVLGLGERLLPTAAGVTNRAAGALSGAAASTTRQLGGAEMRSNIRAFGDAGTATIRPLAQGLTDVFFALLRLLRPALPYVVAAAEAFQSWAHNLREAAGDGPRLQEFIGMLVGHFKQWWELAKSLGETLSILFGSSEESGRTFVESLTGLVDKFNEWLEQAKQTGELKKFFDDSVGLISTVIDWIGSAIKVADILWDIFSLTQTSLGELVDLASVLGEAFTAAGEAIGGAFSGMWEGIKEGFRGAMNWIIEKWNSLASVKAPDWVPLIGGKALLPGIPLLAEGGTMRVGGAAVVGDNGPELLNLPTGAQVTPLPQPAAMASPRSWPDIVLKVDRRTMVRVLGSDIEAQMARGG